MLYGKYADGSIRAPRKDRPRLFENRDEVLEEYRRNIFKASGKEYFPAKNLDDPDDDPVAADHGPAGTVPCVTPRLLSHTQDLLTRNARSPVPMTSEILMMNETCVVLAADSAATVESEHSTKVFSTDKVFRLSDAQPIGVMTYGNAAVSGVPVSLLVESYRDGLEDRVFGSVPECAEDFKAFLSLGGRHEGSKTPLITDAHMDVQAGHMIIRTWNALLDRVRERMDEGYAPSSGGGSFDRVLRRCMEESMSEMRASIPDAPDGTSVETNMARLKRVVSSWDSRPDSHDIPLAFGDFEEEIIDITAARMSAVECAGDFTGLVFAGYGTDENYPSFHELRVGGLFASGLQTKDIGGVAIDAENTSWIEAFAQRDVIDAYLTGMDKNLRTEIVNQVAVLLDEATHTITAASDAKMSAEDVRDLNDILIRFFNELLWNHSFHNYMWPVKSTLRFLSKNEMADLAESLIKFTSLRRRVSDDYETVKEPVDVAIISKHDGFVWVRRKLYFSSEFDMGYSNRSG